MATTEQQTQSKSTDFLTRAMESFCAEISETFKISMTPMVHDRHELSSDEIKATIEMFTAAISVNVSGDIYGNCYMLLDKDAMLMLASVIVTKPNEELTTAGQNNTDLSDCMHDAVVEIGNLLAGGADRISGDFFRGNVLFSRDDIAIGSGDDILNLIQNTSSGQTVSFIPYNITLGSDTVLSCGLMVPEKLNRQIADGHIPEQAYDYPAGGKIESNPTGAVTESIRKMVRSLPTLSDPKIDSLMQTPAEQIMRSDVVWAAGNQSVKQAMDQLQEADAYCLLIGEAGKLDGIVTWIDLAGAASIYLQPIFKQYRRPADDATLQIKLSVIMTSPVCTVTLETPLKSLLAEMTQYHLDCVPVVDENKSVRGVVNTADIFGLLLSAGEKASKHSRSAQ